jgi:hypothetical protein
VIAGQIPAGSGKPVVQRFGKFEIVATGRAIEGEVAAVDDEIRTPRVDIFANAIKVIGQLLKAAGEVGIGNLRQAKFGRDAILNPADVGKMTSLFSPGLRARDNGWQRRHFARCGFLRRRQARRRDRPGAMG